MIRLLRGDCRETLAGLKCGHDINNHVRLPGHPDSAEECYGADDCECGRFRPAVSGEGASR